MSSIRLRKASLNDLVALIELEYQAFDGDWISTRGWRDLLTMPAADVVVATRGEEMAGCIVMAASARSRCLGVPLLAVAPKLQGRGIGTRLLNHALDHAKAEGLCVCRLEVNAGNRRARSLLAHLGFAIAGPADPEPDATLRYACQLTEIPARAAAMGY